MWNAAKDQRHHQIGQGRQRNRVVTDPVGPPYLAHQKVDLASQTCGEPAGPADPGFKARGSRDRSSSMLSSE
jgi:hypothetical protein